MLAPVAVFVYARPDHTKSTIEALAKNKLAHETEVYIYSDAAKNENAIENVNVVRAYLDTLTDRRIFKSVKIIKSQKNKGLAKSVIDGVNEITEQYGEVIVVEDDLISSYDFLQYMNEALTFYKKDEEIWSISGYTFDVDIPKEYKSDVYLSYRGCSWGWATWKDRWNKVDWNVKDYSQFISNKKMRSQLNRGGRDMADMLDAQMQGKIDSWAIRWCYTQSVLNMLTIYPVVSRIKNIGLDGSGTHSGISSKYDATLYKGEIQCKFDKPELDSRILKSFKNKFGTRFDYMIINIKSCIKKIIRMS